MNPCQQWELLLSVEFDDELDETEERALQGHLEGCSRCRSLRAGLAAQRRGLHAAVPGSPSEGFYRHFLEELPARDGGRTRESRRRRHLLGPTVRVPVAALVAGILVAGAALLWPLLSTTASRGDGVPAPGLEEEIRVIRIEPEDVMATYETRFPEAGAGEEVR